MTIAALLTAPRRRRVVLAAFAVSLSLAFVGFVLWSDINRWKFPTGHRMLVERSVGLFARRTKRDRATIRRVYALRTFRRQDQICVMFSTYRDRRGGGLYCYEGADARLVEERMIGPTFGKRSVIVRIMDAMDRD
jgi:hypothetical protein